MAWGHRKLGISIKSLSRSTSSALSVRRLERIPGMLPHPPSIHYKQIRSEALGAYISHASSSSQQQLMFRKLSCSQTAKIAQQTSHSLTSLHNTSIKPQFATVPTHCYAQFMLHFCFFIFKLTEHVQKYHSQFVCNKTQLNSTGTILFWTPVKTDYQRF